MCELLSDYFDEELEPDICSEIDELVEIDSYCEALFNTFSKTLDLVRETEKEMFEVPKKAHIKLYKTLRIEIRKEQI